MGRFFGALLIGLVLGAIFAEFIFPEGFSAASQRWGYQIQRLLPNH